MHAVSAVCVVLTSDITIEQTLWVKHAAGAWEAASGSDSTPKRCRFARMLLRNEDAASTIMLRVLHVFKSTVIQWFLQRFSTARSHF